MDRDNISGVYMCWFLLPILKEHQEMPVLSIQCVAGQATLQPSPGCPELHYRVQTTCTDAT